LMVLIRFRTPLLFIEPDGPINNALIGRGI